MCDHTPNPSNLRYTAPDEAIAAIHAPADTPSSRTRFGWTAAEAGELEDAVCRLKEIGMDGIETLQSDHSPEHVAGYAKLATRFNLPTSGGSDYAAARHMNRRLSGWLASVIKGEVPKRVVSDASH